MNHRSTLARTWALALVGAVALTSSNAASAEGRSNLPPWNECVFRHLPASVDLGGLASPTFGLPQDATAVLLGELKTGTDCSIYDLPLG